MQDKYKLIENELIPLSKYWSIRLGFLDIINNKNAKFSFPDCVNKSWPQFWRFLEYSKITTFK